LFAPAGEALSPLGGLPIFTGPTEMFAATIHLAMMGGIIAAFPVLTLSVYQLLSPLLNRRQRRFAVIFLPAIFMCFLGGGAFAYFVMLPTGFKFLLHFGDGIAVPVIRITEYMSLVTAMIFWLGVIFELPLAMFLLAKLRIVSHRGFRKFRRYVPAAAFVLSALITPTFDIINSTMVAVPIIVLFEVGLFLAWLAEGGAGAVVRKVKAIAVWVLRRPVVAFKAAWRSIKRVGRRLIFW
jgi:sec-independent protein translocase protein TatC